MRLNLNELRLMLAQKIEWIRTKINSLSLKETITMLTNFATIISVIVVLLTLREMQIQRNNAYRPDIVFETVSVHLIWGQHDEDHYPGYSPNPFAKGDFNPHYLQIPSRNIGVGVAKNVTYSFDVSSFTQLINYLNEISDENNYTYHEIDGALLVKNGYWERWTSIPYNPRVLYLLPNAEETYDFLIPEAYLELLENVYFSCGDEPHNIPDIEINLSFEDVQGVRYTSKVFLTIGTYFYWEDDDGNGSSSCQISMKRE